jgi:hypothetical protein
MDGTPKYSKVNQNVLADFALTMQDSPNLTEKEILSKFPEFDNDINAVHSALDYIATVQGGIPKDIGTKFPEFNFGGVDPSKKKDDFGVLGSLAQKLQSKVSSPSGVSQSVSPSEVSDVTKNLMQPLGDEKPVAVNTVAQPQVQQAQTKVKAYAGVAPDATGKDIIQGVEKKLKTGEAVDVGGSIRFEKPEEKALVENITGLDNFAKEQGITRNQLTSTIKDFASEEFLPIEGQAIYKIDKEFEKVSKNATPEQLKKYQEDRNKAKDIVYNKFDTDIKDLNELVTKGKLDGIDVSKEEAELRKLKAAKNNILQTPQQAVDKILKTNPSLTRMDKLLEGKTPEQKLNTLYDGLAMEYYALGKKLGYSFKDIKEGNFGVKTFMGYGDLNLGLPGDGNISGEDRKRFVELRSQLKTLAPVVILNKQPSGKEDNVLNIFSNAFTSQLSPALAAQTQTYQQEAGVISNFLNQAQVDINPEAQAKLDKSLEDYGIGGFAAQTLGSTAGILAPAVLGGMAVGNGIRALGYSRYTAPLADFLVNTKAGQAITAGASYAAGGRIIPNSKDEMNFGSGFIGEIATMLPSPLKKLAPALNKLFGKYGSDAARIITKGVSETGQETAQSLYQIYESTPEGQSVFDSIKQQFGDPSDILKFAISTFIMGGAMGGGADFGMHQANIDAVNQLSPDERAVYDTFTGEQRAKANTDILNIAKEQAPEVPTENLQKQADNTNEAITKLTTELESPETSYSIDVDGIKYEGTSKEDLQSDIDYLSNLNGIINDELYARNTQETETPTDTEQVQQQPIAEEGVGVEGAVVPEADNFVSNLKDDEDVTITVATLDEVPAKFKDRAIESKERTADVQKSFLGIPYGKKETRTVKEKSYTYTATGKEIKDEYNATKPLIKETPEKVKQGQPLVKPSDTANLPQDVQDKIAKLRADEQVDLAEAIPNIDEYKVDGEIDRDKILASPDADAYSEIYDRYDKLITPLLGTTVTETTTENLPQGGEVKETVSEKQVSEPLKDVESTTKALEGKDITTVVSPTEINSLNKKLYDDLLNKQKELLSKGIKDFKNDAEYKAIKDQIEFSEALLSNDTKAIAEAYHKAKAAKSNPDLVQAVEDLLAPKGESKINNVNSQNGNKENKSQKPNPTVVQQAKEADTEGDDTVARNKAKRASVKSALKKLRDDGLLKTADKTLIGKAKKLLRVKSAPMSDAEIDAQMALLDAMADVWKNTTGKDNFYETFIGDIRKGDLSELKKMGGVLFQDTENPAAPTSRLTLAVFEQPLFEKMKGSMVAPQAISDLVKSRGKQIEKDIINMVLDFDKYKGQKRISFDEFRGDVETQIMKLEKIRTRSYADYGYSNLGSDENYGDTETVIFNSPIEHGQKGHFSGDFTTKGLDKTEWELRQIPNTDQWAAVDKNMPAGVTGENIAGYIGTAGEKAEVEKWIADRNEENNGGINQGLFGHIRKWFNKRDGIFHIAELQSDYYQKNKASDLMKPKVSDDEGNAHMNKNVWQPIDKEIADKIKKDWGITTKNDGDVIFAYDRNGQQIASEIIENPKIGLERGQFEQNNVIIEALDTLARRETLDKKLDDGTYQVYTRDGNVIFKTEQEAQQFIKSYDGRFNGAKDAYNATKDAYYEKRRGLQQVEEQKFIQKRQEELAKDKPANIQLKQFVASQKVHELRLLREAIKMAAEDGAETVRFPSQYTLAVIEGYTDATGEGAAPYDIISGDSDRLYEGDEIDYGGERMIVVEQNRSTITVAPKDEVSVMNYNDLLESETDNRIDEIEYEAKRHFDDLDAITREELDNYEPDEWLGGTAKDLLEGYFADNEDAETVKWDDIKSELYDSVRDRYGELQVDDLVGWSGTVWMDGDTIYALEGRNYETFNQPDEYEASSSKEDYYENLSKEQKTVVDKYGELAEQFQKMRPDARTVVDENGMEWLETTVTEADKNNPIVAFQKEGDKVKGAVDFTNNNKAAIYIFDGADITTLAHEMSGHLGRRVLERLAAADPDFAKQYKAVKKWAGVKDVWTTKAEEKFARGFERYLREGKAPTTALKEVFSKLKEWLSGVYRVIKGSSIDIELTDDVRNVFDTLLGKEKTNETGQAKPIGESPQDVTGNIGTDKDAAEKTEGAIPSETIDKLVGKATDRRAAVEAIADENIKEVAKAVTDTKVIDKVMDAIDNNDQLLADLEKKLGIKKICKVF